MDPPSQITLPSVRPSGADLRPTTELLGEECPRFRILIVGRSGTGKSSLINAIFKASLAEVRHDEAGRADIDKGITSPHNEHLIIHDSEGYEPGNEEKFRVLERFIAERSQKDAIAERLHAIWLCVTVPYAGNRMFEEGDEKIFKLNRNKVPIIVVFTKLDLLVASLDKSGVRRGENSLELAEKDFKEKYSQIFERSTTKNAGGHIPYALVATSLPETLQHLVDITMTSIRVETPGPAKGLARVKGFFNKSADNNRLTRIDEDVLDSAQIALATAQRVDMPAKIIASVKVGKKKYWRAIASGLYFLGVSLDKCLYAIHKDITTIWNIRGLDEFLDSEPFRRRMMTIVEDLTHQNPRNPDNIQSKITIASAAAGLAKNVWASGVYQKLPEHVRCLMGYVVDLTLILQAVFQVSLQDRLEGKVTQDRVNEIIYEFHCSDKKKRIHDAIRSFVVAQHPFAKDNVVNRIESLIKDNEMTRDDIQFNDKRPHLPSLLTILRFELTANGTSIMIVNPTTLSFTGRLLVLPDFRNLVHNLDALDVELLLDFILYLLRNGSLSNSGIQEANRKARRLMFKLISEKDALPKSLFINGVRTEAELSSSAIGTGGFGNVFKGELKGEPVALKVLYRGQKKDSLKKDFCREALAWGSLPHRYILPLLGVFEDRSALFLVSPYMTNGTLSQWRHRNQPAVADIHRRMFEVAQAIEYIHAEGVVHGDLKGENILLDPKFRCQMADFGLTRHLDATVTKSNAPWTLNFAAPELFGVCDQCSKPECDGCHDGHEPVQRKKTAQTDVYAFGCLYYAICFDSAPLQGKSEYQITRFVTSGGRPPRKESPVIDDDAWDLIQDCWKHHPSDRPTMQQVVKIMGSWAAHV
ncbi:kinase-like domain-containing protein [Amanita rubescens]|nr:kinase-like domain-containing protein [Amanita rubescens]